MGKVTPPQILILSFLSVIIIGTVLLSLPIATNAEGELSLVDSLFTATSATCVTGLIVQDTGIYFSSFGKWVIFALFQIGGLGIMTFSTLFAVLLGRKIGFNETDVIKRTLYGQNVLGFRKLLKYIILIALGIEAFGAVILFFRWKAVTQWSVVETIQNALFHSVSGFCNAGFSLFKSNLMQFQNDPVTNLTMIFLIVAGGIGFIVIMDLAGLLFRKGVRKKINLHTKTVLTMTLILILSGAIMLFVFEKDNTMAGMSLGERILASGFQSVTARTAGFNTLPIGKIAVPSLMFIVFLMFVGASPGSTGGGIKTTTFAVLGAAIVGMIKNRRRVMIFGRSVPKKIIREVIVIFFLALSWVFLVTIIISFSEGITKNPDGTLSKTLFEVVSAFGTVGLSTGITAGLNSFSKVCLALTMFAGRVGPLTLALALAFHERKDNYYFPEEDLMVG